KDTISLQKALELVIRRFAPLVVLAILLPILWVAGVVLLVVPCLILIAVTYVTIPAFQIEGLGPVASIKRSARLTKGYRWRILALSFITQGVEVSVDQGLQWLYTLTGGSPEMLIALLLWNTLWGLFNCIVVGVAYFELRAAKEGFDVHQVASALD